MFDLTFYSVVREVMGWVEARGITYLNRHDSIMESRYSKTDMKQRAQQRFLEMEGDGRKLPVYVTRTYPVYFGMKLRLEYLRDPRVRARG